MKHISDFLGVYLEVEYSEPKALGGPLFESVRVLDENYAPVGPNLMSMLHNTLSLTGGELNGSAEAERFLSKIAGEISEL